MEKAKLGNAHFLWTFGIIPCRQYTYAWCQSCMQPQLSPFKKNNFRSAMLEETPSCVSILYLEKNLPESLSYEGQHQSLLPNVESSWLIKNSMSLFGDMIMFIVFGSTWNIVNFCGFLSHSKEIIFSTSVSFCIFFFLKINTQNLDLSLLTSHWKCR